MCWFKYEYSAFFLIYKIKIKFIKLNVFIYTYKIKDISKIYDN